MASSNNLASLEPWLFCSASFGDSWISEAFARDNETLTRALQQSLSTTTTNTTTNTNNSFSNSSNDIFTDIDTFDNFVKTEVIPTGSGSDPDMYPRRRSNSISNGKISKRKSRASKRTPTTFIAADPSNFRQMVQQVTGIQFGEVHMPVTSVVKPEPQRIGNRVQNYGLPTLDTSTIFLDNSRLSRVDRSSVAAPREEHVSGVGEGGAGLEFGNFHNFPTLESWRVM